MNLKYASLFLFFTFTLVRLGAQVKIGDNPTDLSPYSILELESTDRALLIPRLTTTQRDTAFDQTAPAGLVIFNTTLQQFQYYFVGTDGVKKWNSVGNQNFDETTRPEEGQTGDIYYDTETNTLFAWNPTTETWVPVTTATTSSTAGGVQEVVTGRGVPLSSNLASSTPGLLYVDLNTGNLYLAADRNNDDVAEIWIRVNGSSGGGSGATGATGPEGPAGPPGPTGPTGPSGPPSTISSATIALVISNTLSSTLTTLVSNTVTNIVSNTITNLISTTVTNQLSTVLQNIGLFSGVGAPSLSTPASPTAGDVYVDETNGNLYTYTTTGNWVSSVSSSTITSIVSSTLTSSTIAALETTTSLTQDTATGEIIYTDEDGGTASATVVSGNGLDLNNILTVGTADGGAYLSSSTLSTALGTLSPTITNIVSSSLTSSTIAALETTTNLWQNPATGIISYTNEDGATATATIRSGHASNLLSIVNGGVYFDSSSLAAASVSETLTTLTQDTATETFTLFYTDENGGTTTATILSGHASNLLEYDTTNGGVIFTQAQLNSASVSETTTVLSTVTSTDTFTLSYTDENLNTTSVELLSSNPNNLLTYDTANNGLLFTQTQSVTTLTHQYSPTVVTGTTSTTSGTIVAGHSYADYTNEAGSTTSVTIVSGQASNLLQVGSDGGAYFTQSSLRRSIRLTNDGTTLSNADLNGFIVITGGTPAFDLTTLTPVAGDIIHFVNNTGSGGAYTITGLSGLSTSTPTLGGGGNSIVFDGNTWHSYNSF